MTTATPAFERFLKNVRLPEELANQCRDEHLRLRGLLLADADLRDIIVSTFLQGSYRRDTGTKPNGEDPHADVDVVVVTTLDPIRYTPDLVVARFTPFLEKYYPGQWERQDRAIKITPAGKDVTLDLVVTAAPSKVQQEFFESVDPTFKAARTGLPAPEPLNFREAFDRIAKSARLEEWQRDPLLIPSRDLGRWERTHPLEQIRWTHEKNDNMDGHYINVVRAIKWWRKENPDGKYPKGYPLEHLVGDTCPDGVGSVAEGVTLALEAIRDNYRIDVQTEQKPILPDRGVPEHDVFKKITPEQFARFWRLVATAAGAAREALNAEANATSVQLWHDLFGEEFPKPPRDEFKESVAAALRRGPAGITGGAIVSGGGRPIVPGRSFGADHE
ncbi:MAG: nucleotidyltransferase [Chloroflexi bacterium]|nr:nucleotidyltransferase [Chloroflexota bacterium]